MGGIRKFGAVAAACSVGLLLSGVSAVALAAPTTQIAQSAEQTAQNYFYAGFEALQQNRLDQAVSMFEGGLQYSPNNAVAVYYLAVSYDRMGAYDKAAPLYQRAATLAPGTEEGRAAQERLRTVAATVPGLRPYQEAPREPESRSIREVFEQSAAGQATRPVESQRNVPLPPPPVGRAAPSPLAARTGPVVTPPYVPAPVVTAPVVTAPVVTAPAAPARAPEPLPSVRQYQAPASDPASRFSMLDTGGAGRLPSRIGVERPLPEPETSSARSALPDASEMGRADNASPPSVPAPVLPAPSLSASPAAGRGPGDAAAPEAPEIVWSTGGDTLAAPPAPRAPVAPPMPSAASPAPMSPSAPSPSSSPVPAPQPHGSLLADLPKGGSTADLNARALQFVASRDGTATGMQVSSATPPASMQPDSMQPESMGAAPAGKAAMRATTPAPAAKPSEIPSAGKPSSETPAGSLNQQVLDSLAAGSPPPPRPAPMPAAAGSAKAGEGAPATGSADKPASEIIDLRTSAGESAAPREEGQSSVTAGRTSARPGRPPLPAPERPQAEQPRADRGMGSSAAGTPAAARVADADPLPTGSTTARLNALMLNRMSAPATTAAPQRAATVPAPGDKLAESAAAMPPAAPPPSDVVLKREDEGKPREPVGTEPDTAIKPPGRVSAIAIPSDTATLPEPGAPRQSAPPSVPERPVEPAAPSGSSRSLNERSLAALSPSTGSEPAPSAKMPNFREELSSRGGMVAALPLPKNPQSLTLPDGTVYYGDLRDEVPHGTGRLVYKDGSIYVGSFAEGRRSGHGVLEMSGGWRYEGEFENNQYNGLGEMSWPDGATYVGEFRAGARTGRGVYWWPNGAKYEGNFVAGEPDGVGTYFYPDGRAETGTWKKGELVSSS